MSDNIVKYIRYSLLATVVVVSVVAAYQKNGMTGVATVLTKVVMSPAVAPELQISSDLFNIGLTNVVPTTGDCSNGK